MPSRALQLGSGLLLMLLAVSALAQTTQATMAATPPFAQLDQMLSETADGLLAKSSQALPAALPETVQPAAEQASSQPDRLRTAVERVRQLGPVIEPILREQGVPTALAAVVLVESGGQPTALSPKGARGLWQLMPETARRYGLVVTPERDERLDVSKATEAAARYLRDLHTQFGDWSVALAAYNAGEQLIGNLLKRSGTNDFQAISYRLPNETRNYVPAVLNAMHWFGGAVNGGAEHSRRNTIVFAEYASGD